MGGEACGQGLIRFNNRIPPEIDAPVTHLDGTPVGRFTAQLFGGPEGTPVGSLKPLYPTTFFRFNRGISTGYIHEVDPLTTEVPAGARGTFVMRAYDGLMWETSSCRGESMPITITVGGGSHPSASLTGLQAFQVNCIPEPSTWTLAAFGALVLGWASRRQSSSSLTSNPCNSRQIHHRSSPLRVPTAHCPGKTLSCTRPVTQQKTQTPHAGPVRSEHSE